MRVCLWVYVCIVCVMNGVCGIRKICMVYVYLKCSYSGVCVICVRCACVSDVGSVFVICV